MHIRGVHRTPQNHHLTILRTAELVIKIVRDLPTTTIKFQLSLPHTIIPLLLQIMALIKENPVADCDC